MSRSQIEYDRYALRIDGKHTLIRSGALHYFRLPSQALWWDRLCKIKAAGYNTVDLYFCWDYHSPAPGKFDFTGIRDVDTLFAMTQRLGLFVIARPGPYINAEYTGGGLPGWLLADPAVVPRNRNRDGVHVWNEPYMAAVRDWWGHIVPKIAQAPNVIMMQIENEYATQDLEPDYMQALYDLARQLGVTVPLMHNDMYAAGLFEDIVDLYAFDNYPVTSFDQDWRESEGVFGVIDGIEDNIRPFCQNRPVMIAELQAGWFGTWKGYKYEDIIYSLGREHIALVTKSALGKGVGIFNHYKIVGGTNWGFMGSTDTITSYDFAAPIAETGLLTERLYEAKAINLWLETFPVVLTESRQNLPLGLSDPAVAYSTRMVLDETLTPTEAHWCFLRNLSVVERTITLTDSALDRASQLQIVHSKAMEVLVLPYRMPLQSGAMLLLSTTEVLYQGSGVLVLKANRPSTTILALKNGETVTLSKTMFQPDQLESVVLSGLTVLFLGQAWVDRFWQCGPSTVVLGPDSVWAGTSTEPAQLGQNILHPSGLPCWYTLNTMTGELNPYPKPTEQETTQVPSLPQLSNWALSSATPDCFSSFQAVSAQGADFDSNQFYEGSCWYTLDLAGLTKATSATLVLDARHIWAVWLNGTLLAEGHHWAHNPGEPASQPVEILLSLLNEGTQQRLLIFVDGLGHPKGFHDDAQTPQGVISLKLQEADQEIDLLPCLRYLPQFPNTSLKETVTEGFLTPPPAIRLTSHFVMPETTGFELPLGLQLGSLECERINLYLNGVLIGRYWQACQNQQVYYLPPGILKTEAGEENVVELLLLGLSEPPTRSVEQMASQIELTYFGALQLSTFG